MPRNITVYISDELDQRMKEFGEVNWSEIARQGIEAYIEGRVKEVAIKNKVSDTVINEFDFYLASLRDLMSGEYRYSIWALHNDFNIDVIPREKKQFSEIFHLLSAEYSRLLNSFDLFKRRKDIHEFDSFVTRLIGIFQRYSNMVRNFAELAKEKTYKIDAIGQPRSHIANQYLDETYASFRAKYNLLVMSFVKFVYVTRDLHKQHIDNHRVYELLAPRLVDFRLSAREPALEIPG